MGHSRSMSSPKAEPMNHDAAIQSM